jgi:uncharacterized protein
MGTKPTETNPLIKPDNHPISVILFYLTYTFSISWFCWISIIIANTFFNTLNYGEPIFWILYTIGSLGSAISAFLIYRKFKVVFQHKSFIHFIFGHSINGKIGAIFLVFLVWRLWMIWFSVGIDNPWSILTIILNLPFLMALGGLEELGWRGILQPKLEGLISYFPSLILVSIIWSSWHIPLWFIKGSVQSGFSFWLYFVLSVILTASFTALYKYTHNLFLSVVNHAWFNGCIGLALFVGKDGVMDIHLNGKLVALFIVEFIVSIILGRIYSNKK